MKKLLLILCCVWAACSGCLSGPPARDGRGVSVRSIVGKRMGLRVGVGVEQWRVCRFPGLSGFEVRPCVVVDGAVVTCDAEVVDATPSDLVPVDGDPFRGGGPSRGLLEATGREYYGLSLEGQRFVVVNWSSGAWSSGAEEFLRVEMVRLQRRLCDVAFGWEASMDVLSEIADAASLSGLEELTKDVLELRSAAAEARAIELSLALERTWGAAVVKSEVNGVGSGSRLPLSTGYEPSYAGVPRMQLLALVEYWDSMALTRRIVFDGGSLRLLRLGERVRDVAAQLCGKKCEKSDFIAWLGSPSKEPPPALR